MIPLNFTLPVAGPVTADIDNAPQECQRSNGGIQIVVYAVDQAGAPVNLRAASAMKIRLLRPDGTTVERDAAFLTSGVDGALALAAAPADLAQVGTYQVQAEYVLAGKTQSTRRARFRVGANID
ncbi:MAG: hypothetical protein V4510_09995 [bacterium]